MIIKKINKSIGLLLFLILFTFPFSYQNLNVNWIILFSAAIIFLLLHIFLHKHISFNNTFLVTVQTILLLILFDFTEIVNFGQLFNIPNPLGWRIPLSTVFLSIATFVFVIKILMEKKLEMILPDYLKHFFAAMLFLVALMVLFYPFMKYQYHMSSDSNYELLNKVIKYALLSTLFLTHLRDESAIKKKSWGLAISIGLAITLNLFLLNP